MKLFNRSRSNRKIDGKSHGKAMLITSIKLFLLCLLSAGSAWGAACCGGGFAMPSVITGDDKAMVTGSWAQSKVDTEVNSGGVWQRRKEDDRTQIFRIDGAHIFADRYQAGFSIPVQTREKQGEQGGRSSGLGDVSLMGGYEYLPDWDYHPWRPKGVGFLTLVLPTGKSIYESDTASGLDTEGRGFWSLGAGTILVKNWSAWDVNSTLEAHRAFEKHVDHNGFEGTIRPGWGGSFGLGAGWSLKDVRLGGALSWNYEDPIEVQGTVDSQGNVQRFATGTVSASYVFPEAWATTLSYSDQTVFGDPTSASLSKSVAFFVQKRWQR